MRTDELNYGLPAELVAQEPTARRSESRLLVMERGTGALRDRMFGEIGEYLRAGDCLVVNNTKVLPARFFARRATGARIEGLFLGERRPGVWEAMLRNARRVKAGDMLELLDRAGEAAGAVRAAESLGEGRWLLEAQGGEGAHAVLERIGYAPLPPYIRRRPQEENAERAARDLERYQTVFAREAGAVAAPTAGLHFTEELLGRLEAKGVRRATVTLHVGAGTFKPVTAERLEEHEIHAEWYSVDEANAAAIHEAKAAGGRIVAVGTTSVRTLESAARGRRVEPGAGWTRLFIQPGYAFQVVDAMVTNFHLPRSTLLALVGAFAGLEEVLAAYRHAVAERYRFYSYGDAMLIV